MFKKILIANRGEIACRVARTAREMGVSTVAVYSDADRHALHVELCDEAIHIGEASVGKSYLCHEKVIAAALASGAQAIHPGYGFLSENAEFARLCQQNDLIFIGPPANAITSMGAKDTARRIMSEAGVPVLPGYDDPNQNPNRLHEAANDIGYPLLIKAAFGGGGKGMRVVEQSDDFQSALEAVKRESLAAFGNDQVLLERYLPVARHIEIQVFADAHGQAIHLFERDCSMQRRHQKVVEEAPAPSMTESLRGKMGQAAVDCAKAIDYLGAGTVEFLLAPDGTFYFMEMNTRLQVEHPVTEAITGQDLVEWQFRVASGEPLPQSAHSLRINGHAIEARIYAENPDQQFLPATGNLDVMALPKSSSHVRVDTGVREGDTISIHYDPMIAKLIVWGEDRDTALRHLHNALTEYRILGLPNNLFFLKTLTDHPFFVSGQSDTRFIEHHLDELVGLSDTTPEEIWFIATCFDAIQAIQSSRNQQEIADDRYSPWADLDHWRNQLTGGSCYWYCLREDPLNQIKVAWTRAGEHMEMFIHSEEGIQAIASDIRLNNQKMTLLMNHKPLTAVIKSLDDVANQSQLLIGLGGREFRLQRINPGQQSNDDHGHAGQLTAPMPGTVVSVLVQQGDSVEPNDPLMIVEAMKMEHQIRAPQAGVVETVCFQQGDQVSEGNVLLVIT